MSQGTVNILFTSAGRRVELLRWFDRARLDEGIAGTSIAADIDPLAPALQVADRTYIVPPLSDPGYIDALARIVRDEDIDLIVPLIDPDVPVLAEGRSVLEANGARVVALSAPSVEITMDKWHTYKLLRDLEVPTPRTWIPSDGMARDHSFPLVVKPRRGSAGQGVHVVRSQRELEFFLPGVDEPVIQEYLPGPEITTDVFCGFDGGVLGLVSRERIEVRSGEVSKAVTMFHPEIIEYCVTIAKGLEAEGPITVQCMLAGTGRPYFTEVNPRFGGGMPLGVAAGMRSPHWLLRLAAGLEVDAPPLGSYETGLYMTRFDDSFILRADEGGRLAGADL